VWEILAAAALTTVLHGFDVTSEIQSEGKCWKMKENGGK